MEQFLIREFTDNAGNVYVEQPRENERMTLVEAKDKEEAKEKVEGLLNYVKPPKTNWCWLEEEYKKLGMFDKE
ncbi:hypothetical protein BUZ54_07615 [Staphylococcus hominis]|uniref:DUF1381 domain-containing protein n=1 Tax=Staphylococcus hominis TaxID=1290 RepID=UPI000D1D7044|nr:DUF1381 domain-containing protein [Staphylococcus hominis]PTK25053.1 hypothetical protein BUZ54_07615 [Staphylococcus hominis]